MSTVETSLSLDVVIDKAKSDSYTIDPSPSLARTVKLYSQKVTERLRDALLFLLHPNSPLNKNNIDFYEKCTEFNPSLHPKFDIQRINDIKRSVESFKCDERHMEEMESMHALWQQWHIYEDDIKQQQTRSSFSQTEEESMKWDYLDFMIQHKVYCDTRDNDEPVENIMIAGQFTTAQSLQLEDDPETAQKIRELKQIHSRHTIAKWLKKWKSQRLTKYEKCTKAFKTVRWKKDVHIYKLPMNEWSWKQVVSFIEYSQSKHFSSIFYQYQIDGQELCAMQFKTFEFLIEYALMQNQNEFETDFEQLKRERKDWKLSHEIANLLRYIHCGRIQSHVVSRYYLMYDILKRNKDSDETAQTVYNIITSLTSHYSNTPKQFWKINAYFYCKLDNILAVLITDSDIRGIYQRVFPLFLVDDEELFMMQDSSHTLRPQLTSPKSRSIMWQSYIRESQKVIDLPIKASTFAEDEDDDTIAQRNAAQITTANKSKKRKIRYDCFDFVADKCCNINSRINMYIHSAPRVYLSALIVFLCLTVTGSTFITLWFYNAAITSTTTAINLAVLSVAESEINYARYEYHQPQTIQYTLYGTLKIYSEILQEINTTSNVYKTGAYVDDASFDFLTEEILSYPNAKHISSVALYGNHTNTLIGASKINDTFALSVFDGKCMKYWKYDETTKERDTTRPILGTDCDYKPRERPWYTALIAIGGIHNSVWTKPYYFSANVFGMTLSTMIEYNGAVYVLLTEFSVDSLKSHDRIYNEQYQKVLLVPPDAVVMTVTPSLDVMHSSVDEIDLYEVDCGDHDCRATHEMITGPMEFMRNHSDLLGEIEASDAGYISEQVHGYIVSVFPVAALAMESLLFGRAPQYGYVVIVHDETNMQNIDSLYSDSEIITVIALIFGVILIIYNIRFYRVVQPKREKLKPNKSSKDVYLLKHMNSDENEENVCAEIEDNKTLTDIELQIMQVPLKLGKNVNNEDRSQTNTEETKLDPKEDEEHKLLHTEESFNIKASEDDDDSYESSESAINTQTKIMVTRKCQLTQSMLMIVIFLYMLVIFVFLSLYWGYYTTTYTAILIDDVLAPQEWNIIRDKLFDLIESAETIKELMGGRLNMEGMNEIFEDHQVDEIFTNTMKSFVNRDNLYAQYYIYFGKPDGTFRGVRAASANGTDLVISTRDITNNYTYTSYYTDEWNMLRNISHPLPDVHEKHLYDPRCRPWYVNAIKKRFSGDLKDAFPDDTWDEFSADDLSVLSSQTLACKKAVEEYTEMFVNNTNDKEEEKYTIWTTYKFTSTQQKSLTASAIITEKDSNTLLGVIGIDFKFSAISQLLNETVGISEENERWFSWIFNADKNDPFIIGSSEFNLYPNNPQQEEEGLQLQRVINGDSYSVTDHPSTLIKVISTEVLDHYGVDSDIWRINESSPYELNTPMDYPISQGGKISYYPNGSGLDWFVMKLVDAHDITDVINDAFKTISFVLISILLLTFICFKEITLHFTKMYGDRNEDKDGEDIDIDYNNDKEHDYTTDMFKVKDLIEGAANKVWKQLCLEDTNELMTTIKAKEFLADRANQHITEPNNMNQVFIDCVLQYTEEKDETKDETNTCYKCNITRRLFVKFMYSSYYSMPCQLIILCHIIITFWEPATPSLLRENGLSPNLIITNILCIMLEFIFCIVLNTLHRYYIFSMPREHLTTICELYYGANHRHTKLVHSSSKSDIYSIILRGPHFKRYWLRIIIWLCILSDFLRRLISREGTLSYRVPALPFLFVVEVRMVWEFFFEFMSAIHYASDVIISYFTFIIIFAICAMSLFYRESEFESESAKLATRPVDSFVSISRSIIIAFVYISTGENYNAVVAESLYRDENEDNIIAANGLFVCLVFVVLGLFAFIPMIIHRFEESFYKLRIVKNEVSKFRKSRALIAAFIMLDMDGNLEIDRSEFEQLVSHSILINKSELFDVFNADDSDDVIDINEFVASLCKEEFRSKMFYHGELSQNKVQAYLECNIFRRYRQRLTTFTLLVLPVFALALVRGHHAINNRIVDYFLELFFILNFLDILLRWFAFGRWRFFDLARYPNSPYTSAAVNKYKSRRNIYLNDDKQQQDTSTSKIIRLSASDRKWVVNNLRDTRPQSIFEKSLLTICHRLEIFSMLLAVVMIIVVDPIDITTFHLTGYQRFALEIAVFVRFFTLLRSNQRLLFVVFTVFPQFISLITFLVLYIYCWARLGSTLFGDGDREVITEEIYSGASNINTNFSSLAHSMLTLIQLMIGEGWHEIMYYNVLSTSLTFSLYFIFYIGWVTIIIANVFVGLFLADIDRLKSKQEEEQTINSKMKTLNAKHRLNELHYELQQIEDKRKQKLKQIKTFKQLLNMQVHKNKDSAKKSTNSNNNNNIEVNPFKRARNTTFMMFD